MDDKATFYILLIVGALGVFFGFAVMTPNVDFAEAFSGGGNSLSANILSVTGGDEAGSGAMYLSFDNLQNIHPVLLPETDVRVLQVRAMDNYRTLFAGTTKGLFISRNGGLNWERVIVSGFKQSITQPDQLSTTTTVLDILPSGPQGSYFMSAYNGGRGVLYHTENEFFTVEKIADFKNEAAYALYAANGHAYLGMSNGQLIRYSVSEKTLVTLTEFGQPITRIERAADGFYYVALRNGTLHRAPSLSGEFSRVRIPGGGFFSAAKLLQFELDAYGTLYVRTKDGIYRSFNGGNTFVRYEDIPLLTDAIDTFGVMDGTIHILSGGRLHTSSYEGVVWKVQDVPYPKPIWNSYFIGGGKVVITQ